MQKITKIISYINVEGKFNIHGTHSCIKVENHHCERQMAFFFNRPRLLISISMINRDTHTGKTQ